MKYESFDFNQIVEVFMIAWSRRITIAQNMNQLKLQINAITVVMFVIKELVFLSFALSLYQKNKKNSFS